MSQLVSIDQWKKDHIVKSSTKTKYLFYCGRIVNIKECEDVSQGDICASCLTIFGNASICTDRRKTIDIGDIIHCPHEVSETGQIKIVGDQTHCKPNVLQSGTIPWDYLARMYDPDFPDEITPYFEVSKEEIKEWLDGYA